MHEPILVKRLTPSGRMCFERVRAGLRQHESERGVPAVRPARRASPPDEASAPRSRGTEPAPS